MEATIEAGEQRLRPIIMTSLAFAFGALPLAIAMGAGANARHSIGTGIIGAMIGETTLAMLYVPLLFYLFDRMSKRSKEKNEAKAKADAGVSVKEAPSMKSARWLTCASLPFYGPFSCLWDAWWGPTENHPNWTCPQPSSMKTRRPGGRPT